MLRQKLSTTNAIESCPVDGAAGGTQRKALARRRSAGALDGHRALGAEKKFRRIKGYQEILLLKERLNPRVFSRRRSGQ